MSCRPRSASAAASLAAASIGVLLVSCASVQQTTSSPGFQNAHPDAEYCELSAVKQHRESTCGLACIESLLHYWELGGTQDELEQSQPAATPRSGYSLAELKGIAEARGLTAYSVSFEDQPLELLYSQLEKGRPTLLAIRCPIGRYFGDAIPIIEHLDSSVIRASVREERLAGAPIASTGDRRKDHYVVAFGYDRAAKKILVMDPAYGLVSVGESRLLGFWGEQDHTALVCGREDPTP